MTLIFFFFSCVSAQEPLWHVADTGIFQPLHQDQVVLGENGRVYVLDKRESHIKVFSEQGIRLASFSRKGRGPGEMMFPNRIFLASAEIILHDFGNGTAARFDLDGNYLSQVKVPTDVSWFVKVVNGWVFGTWRYVLNIEDPGGLFWCDDQFENRETLLALGSQNGSNHTIAPLNLDHAIPFNPAVDRPFLIADPSGRRVFLLHRGTPFTISVFDPVTKNLLRKIEKKWRRLPFNHDWGHMVLRQNNQRPQQGMQLKFKPNFPEYFPHAKSLQFMDNRLFLRMWTADADKYHRLVVLDDKGEQQTALIPAKEMARIGGVAGNHVLVFTFDEQQQAAGLALCANQNLVGFLEAHPMPEHSSGGVIEFQ